MSNKTQKSNGVKSDAEWAETLRAFFIDPNATWQKLDRESRRSVDHALEILEVSIRKRDEFYRETLLSLSKGETPDGSRPVSLDDFFGGMTEKLQALESRDFVRDLLYENADPFPPPANPTRDMLKSLADFRLFATIYRAISEARERGVAEEKLSSISLRAAVLNEKVFARTEGDT